MKNLKDLAGSLCLFAIFGLWLVGCDSGEKAQTEQSIRIGAILPMTGSLAVMGENERNAILLAAEHLNKERKVVEILLEDGKGNATDAVSAANKLINIDDVDLLITSTTGASLAVEPVATQNGINLIAFCMDPDVAGKSPFSIRYYLGIQEEADAINKYFSEGSNAAKVGILYARVPALEKAALDIYAPHLRGLGIEVPFIESYQIGETAFRTVVLKMKDTAIDHLIILGYGFEYPNLLSEIDSQQLTGKIKVMGGWGFLYTSVPIDRLESVLVSGPAYVFKDQDIAGEFSRSYSERYGAFPNFDAAFAYDVVVSLATNFTKADMSSPLKEKLIKAGELSGVVGQYHFNPAGNMIVPTGLGIFRNGRIVPFP